MVLAIASGAGIILLALGGIGAAFGGAYYWSQNRTIRVKEPRRRRGG